MSKKTPHVILAEDDPFLAEAIGEALQEHGAHVTVCGNGEEILQVIKVKKPDLLLLDLLMPKMDGFATMEKLKGQGMDVPIVILTNLNDDDNKDRCNALGAVGFFVKSDLREDEIWPMVQKYLV